MAGENGQKVALVRAWALTAFGCIAIAAGLLDHNAPAIMVGFATLGTEPQLRAAVNGAINGR